MQYTGKGFRQMLEPLFLLPVFQALPIVFQGSIETMRDTQSPSVCADSVSFRFPAVDRIIWQNNAAGNMFHSADKGPPVPLLLSSKRRESFPVLLRQYMQASKSRKHIRRHVPAIVLHNNLAHSSEAMFAARYSAFPEGTRLSRISPRPFRVFFP